MDRDTFEGAYEYAMMTIAANLKRARKTAGITVEELNTRLKTLPLLYGITPTFVEEAERAEGVAKININYIRAVLKACDLPADWKWVPVAKMPGYEHV